MTPTPQEMAAAHEEHVGPVSNEDRIVISGMSGLYPKSHNIKELSNILYNKINPVSLGNLRWQFKHPELGKYSGNVPELDRFDGQFFKVHYRQGNCMDPMSRKLLEQAYSAIYDAGINPESLSGKKIGVFIGSCFSESDKNCFYDANSKYGFGITGCCKAMFANRISYWLNAKGPSICIDESCCSSAAALEQAYFSIIRGDCESAIVGASTLCLHPQTSIQVSRVMKQSVDGKHKSFDANADGLMKSEAINVLFLQKAKDAMRVYGELVHAKTEYIGILKTDLGPLFGFLKDNDASVLFLKNFYSSANVSPHDIEYVEAFGAAVPDVDKAELEVIEKVFCDGKESPLLVGSIMSNIGYLEAATAIAGVTKVLLGYHNGLLASNLNCDNQRQDIDAIREGRIEILTNHKPFNELYAAVNGFSITGLQSHILLRRQNKNKDLSRYKSNIPHLVIISARQNEAVINMIENLKSRPIDPEELALLHNIHQSSISGHLGRGFVILDTNKNNETISLAERAEYFDNVRRPLWFVYSGMGSQWAGMGSQLLRIPIFAAAIERCHRALEPKGIDIVHIISSNDDHIFDNILHSFVGIAAIQIGLTDVLHALDLVPDGIIGHSVGELGCAYADGCLTAEEMILSAYSRGLISLQTPFIRGSMAAVGLGYKMLSTMIPSEIEIACHNGPESCTISGPADIMRDFVAELTAKKIFAKEVPCSNIAYHSRYIAEAGPGLLHYLKQVIKMPKARSDRWVSTSVPKDRWNETLAQYSSAEYHTNNLLCPVLFEETLSEIPNNAVIVEVAPHGLLQAILKRSLPTDCKNISLTRRKHPDNALMLLEAIGKVYMEGYQPKVQTLYPKVEMPVSTGTPFLSHHVKWAHEEKWSMPTYQSAIRRIAAASSSVVSLYDVEHRYLNGHIIEEKIVYPYTAALVSVWDTFAMTSGVSKKQLSVKFYDIKLNIQPILDDQSESNFKVAIHKGSGSFEVLNKNIKIVSGYIIALKSNNVDVEENYTTPMNYSDNDLDADDVYDLLSERNYFYSGEFRSIVRVSANLNEAELIWNNNWVTFIDGLLQLNILKQTHNYISKPTKIDKISIDVDKHRQIIGENAGDKLLLKAEVQELYDNITCGGIVIEGVKHKNLPAIASQNIQLASLEFIQHCQTDVDVMTALLVFLQIIAENMNKTTLNIIGLTDYVLEGSVFDAINKISSNIFGINIHYKQFSGSTMKNSELYQTADAVIVYNLSADDKVISLLQHILRQDILVITEETKVLGTDMKPSELYSVLFTLSCEPKRSSHLQLVRWKPKPHVPITTAITVRTPNDYALLSSTRSNLSPKHRLLVFSPYPAPVGLKEIIRAWRNERNHNSIQLMMVKNESNNLIVNEVPKIDLAVSVVKQNNWGGEYYVPIKYNVTQHVMLKTSRAGDYDSFYWAEAPTFNKDALTVNVLYAGICNADLKKANGTIILERQTDNCFGMDYSGTTASGTRVMGITFGGAISSQLRAHPKLLWPVPDHWSLEDAATVPLPYVIALYCLKVKCILVPEDPILIHGGCGAIGQAAISVALSIGCQVFTTVSDIEKKRFLLKLFPQLKENHVGNSRDTSFVDMVLLKTKGRGCKAVLNNLKNQELQNMSYKCVDEMGHSIDLNYISVEETASYGMSNLSYERHNMHINISLIFKEGNEKEFTLLQRLLSEAIAGDYVRPLSRISYQPNDVSRGFKLLAISQHRGRVLIHLNDNIPHAPRNRITLKADFCHLIISDEEKFAFKLANKLIECGATKIHIHCKAYSFAKADHIIRSYQKIGIQVKISSHDINTKHNVENIINNAKQLVSCVSRAANKLPATLLSLPDLKNRSSEIWRGALDALQYALSVPQSTLAARVIPEENISLLEQIAAIAGIPLTKEISMSATLEDLGLRAENIDSLSLFLKGKYHTDFNENLLPNMTLEDLLQFELSVNTIKEVKGIAKFFAHVEPDELQASVEMVFMSTITSGSFMRDNEIDMDQPFMCIVPGMEGAHVRFDAICKRLKLSALVLQPSLDYPNKTFLQTARTFTKSLINSGAVKNKFYLLGYESGIFTALEMARILEEHGLSGVVYCIGFAPDELIMAVEEALSEYKTEEELQNAVASHMCSLLTDKDTTQLNQLLLQATSWPQKLEVCKRFLNGHLPHSMQYAVSHIENALMRIQQVRQYNISDTVQPLRSRLILMRAASAQAPKGTTSLQQYSQQPVIVKQLQTQLEYCTEDVQCAAIINQYLDPEILAEFENTNICDSYLISSGGYLTVQHNFQ